MGLIHSKPDIFILKQGDLLSYTFKFFIFLFIASSIFDPADHIFKLKVPLFIACWLFGGLVLLKRNQKVPIPLGLLLYVLLMLLIPIISILHFFIIDGSQPFEGFMMIKAYLLISFAILLYLTNFDAIKYLTFCLTITAILTLVIHIILLVFPDDFSLWMHIYHLGEDLKLFSLDNRKYGDVNIHQIYFVLSSMFVIPIAFYFEKWIKYDKNRTLNFILLATCVYGMFLSGTRNNIIISILLPLALIFYYSKHKLFLCFLASSLIATSFVVFNDVFNDYYIGFLDPKEPSNLYKLSFFWDYINIFNNFGVSQFFFGDGLGSYNQWTIGRYFYLTELTYFEVFRNFGFVMGGVMMLLIIFPLMYLFIRPSYKSKHLIIAYSAYLAMCILNPMFFSSTGMMILAILIADIFNFYSFKKN